MARVANQEREIPGKRRVALGWSRGLAGVAAACLVLLMTVAALREQSGSNAEPKIGSNVVESAGQFKGVEGDALFPVRRTVFLTQEPEKTKTAADITLNQAIAEAKSGQTVRVAGTLPEGRIRLETPVTLKTVGGSVRIGSL